MKAQGAKFDSQYPHKSQAQWHVPLILELGRKKHRDTWNLLICQFSKTRALWFHQETLSQNISWKAVKEDTWHRPLVSTNRHVYIHMHPRVHTCMHTCTCNKWINNWRQIDDFIQHDYNFLTASFNSFGSKKVTMYFLVENKQKNL